MFEPKHSELLQQFADKYGLPDQDADHAREWTLHLAEQFAYSFPIEGWGTKKAGTNNPPSTDVICRPEPPIKLVGYDVVVSAGSPDAELNLHPHGEDISNQIFISVTPKNHLSSNRTSLGASLFWAWAGYKKYRAQLIEEIDVLIEDLKPDHIRWFFTVGGDKKPSDPWSDVGAWFDDPQHLEIARSVMKLLKSKGLKSHLTLCGGLNEDNTVGDMYKTEQQRFAIVDRAAQLINEFHEDFVLVEIWNEYLVNGSNTSWCRAMARRLSERIPMDIPIALSTPDSVMGGASDEIVSNEIEKMYGDLPEAAGRTLHSTRPDQYWNPYSIRRVDDYRYMDGEPKGPGASAGGDVSDPVILGNDLNLAIQGDALGYNLHTEIGVWGHHLAGPYDYYHPEWKRFRDITNWLQICDALNAVRYGQPIPGPEPEPVIPYDEEKSVEFGLACNDVYAEANVPKDAGMISVHSSRAAWDYYSGTLPWEESKTKHINELRGEYGLPPI